MNVLRKKFIDENPIINKTARELRFPQLRFGDVIWNSNGLRNTVRIQNRRNDTASLYPLWNY
jgi:hypothetical protein